ncbi:MAG: hypothetical protein ABR532_02330 [Candidatus Dormibacteria bacterium]
MPATLAAPRTEPVLTGSLLRIYVPAVEPVPALGEARCSFEGCPWLAEQSEFVGDCEVALTCDGHRLRAGPERSY